MDLTDYRNKIDSIDDEICRLFTERMNVVNEIGEYKRSHDLPVNSGSREREVLARISKQLPEDLEDFGRVLYRSMFDVSKAYEAMYKEKDSPLYKAISSLINADPAPFPKRAVVACQGREGAYSQIAAEKLFEVPEIMYNSTFEGVIRMVTDGLCEYGILPIENSTAGSVNEIYDLLIRYNVHIVRSTRVRIDHQLLAAKGAKMQDIIRAMQASKEDLHAYGDRLSSMMQENGTRLTTPPWLPRRLPRIPPAPRHQYHQRAASISITWRFLPPISRTLTATTPALSA